MEGMPSNDIAVEDYLLQRNHYTPTPATVVLHSITVRKSQRNTGSTQHVGESSNITGSLAPQSTPTSVSTSLSADDGVYSDTTSDGTGESAITYAGPTTDTDSSDDYEDSHL